MSAERYQDGERDYRKPEKYEFNKRGVVVMPSAETKDIKAAVLELVDDLPNDATWEDVMYRVYVREAIEAGRRDAAEGRLVDLAEVRRRFGLPE